MYENQQNFTSRERFSRLSFKPSPLECKTGLQTTTLPRSDYQPSAENSGSEELDVSGNVLCIN
jgi:hypothetical protein